MTLTIRTATAADLPELLPIEQAVFGSNAWTRAQFADELARIDDTRWYAVAEADGDVVGYGGQYLNAPDADVQTVAVAAGRQREGIGRALMLALIEHAWSAGCSRMFLEVHSGNAAALALYDALGFTRMGRRARYYPDGGDAVTMRLRRSEPVPLSELGTRT